MVVNTACSIKHVNIVISSWDLLLSSTSAIYVRSAELSLKYFSYRKMAMAQPETESLPPDRDRDMALNYALKVMGLDRSKLKDKQEAAIYSVMNGNDTMVVLPTGYGKSLVYQVVPHCMDYLQHLKECSCDDDSHILQKNIAIVISPLTALMSDQVKSLRQLGIRAINVAAAKSDEEKCDLKNGKFSVVFATPESLLKSGTGLLHSSVYRDNVCGIFVDEGHCVAKWYVYFVCFL